jgi:hypothetical protein
VSQKNIARRALRVAPVACALGVACGDGSTIATTPPGDPPDAGAADGAWAPPDGSASPEDAQPASDAGADGVAPSGCIDDVSAGDHVYTCDGLKYDTRVPAACARGGCGIVLDVHGATMSARMEDANTNMRSIGAREGYVVVQPNASGTPPNAVWNPPSDYPKVWAFFELAIKVFAIDRKRVHMTGFSQGGRMTFTFLCQHADVIASAAPAAETGCSETELRAAKREVPILYMHGREDALINFNAAAIPQRNAVVSAWSMGSPTTVGSDANYAWSRYTNAKGTVFEFLEHGYTAPPIVIKGHCYPGSTDPGGAPGQLFSFACTPPSAFVWGEEVMKFFKAHPLP